MKSILLLAGVLLLSPMPVGQDPSPSRPSISGVASQPSSPPVSRPTSRPSTRPATQDARQARVSDADIKKLGDALATLVDPAIKDEYKKKEAAKKDFAREFERIEKTVKPGTLLAMPEVWVEVFYSKRERDLPKSPSGLGRVEEKKISEPVAGKPAEFRYGLLLPNGFDIKKRYPLIIALHDKPANRDREVSGPVYLNEVWMKLPKEERDQFIIVAPTMGPNSAGKEFRVEWGDSLHVKSVALPLRELLSKYPVDFDRVYLEGTGDGGEFAMHFALSSPHLWAAVAVRSAVPRFPQLLQNGGSLPMVIHLRAGSPLLADPKKQTVDQQRQALGLPLEVKEDPAPEKPAKTPFASDVILEASSPIAAFLASKKRNLAPKKMTFVTDGPKQGYWTRLVKFEPDPTFATKLTASVDEASNTIDLQTAGIEDLKVYLSDRLINLDRPIKITVNGQPHTERQFTRSLDTLVKYFDDNPIDPGLQPTAAVDHIKVPPAESQPTESKPK